MLMPLCWSVQLGMVPSKLIYGLNTALFEVRLESPILTTGNDAHGALTWMPPNGTGHRISCKSKHTPSRTMIQTVPRDVSAC